MDWTLRPHPSFAPVKGPVLLVVMDGVGIGAHDESDAVWLARTPTLDQLAETAASRPLRAHGTAVGLPSDGDMGNSEVGHNALGAGRVFDQGAKRVNLAIESGEIFEGEVWKEGVARVRESGEPLHFIGLLSDGNVHSHIDHLFAMLRKAHAEGVKKARVHALLDGRDVPETSALEYVEQLEAVLKELNDGGADYRVASGGGRMTTTMDRYEADWGMVERGWNAHVHGRSEHRFPSLRAAVEGLREQYPDTIDQFLPEFVITGEGGEPVGPIRDGAAVIFFNFRGDRAIEITRAFTEEGFDAFDRGTVPDVLYAGMMQYDGDLHLPKRFLVTPPTIDRTIGEYLARNGVTQFACSETQKYGHVTYFWNGNRSGQFDAAKERYLEIPSDGVPFEQRPWMKAAEITDATIAALKSGDHRQLRINYANGDMVGHTGHREASVTAVQCVDLMLSRVLPVIAKLEGAIIVTADHGNADQMYEKDKKTGAWAKKADGSFKARTSHTLNPVPCHIWAPGRELALADVEAPGLANVAATTLQLLGFAAPEGYAPSLLK
ncbi:MAG TPA: 2,3-bisphosphoglycerate-independent phosphoglycerate mutase [Polyangiaceae bacterium LLY-WYZ-15_(1-7)]|nr:phosphoglycerate mutase (2,3-diphosphoglycerate-independent) [Sandaracinus sp.]HJL03523.1 2,3-bisphosphoglycerate-independent phosphoglycerate mutase [Polyangiaceae bacterium LLY-WYZ-15_(1-7)]MBJ70672.1 phosphoglycerate mutase (2,3-diphosphoglycerate-independent) [Sandaracinus sp.]HJL09435.1 2,3-bisphosphoglycerate-independent phosphoglycerate mutase [Polyangiaceae bacterium LLY-WYZ-15_(1-7)]HJL38085.1 2,3-bisphosphoglycerate-independent phosphoglycerate mutase [Polyangiaceae bacterium LLY-W